LGTRFLPGNKLGGRTHGSTNKLTRTIKQVFEEVFINLQEDPVAKLEAWAKKNPTEFYKLAIKLVPTQFIPNDNDEPITIRVIKEGKQNGNMPELIQTTPESTEDIE